MGAPSARARQQNQSPFHPGFHAVFPRLRCGIVFLFLAGGALRVAAQASVESGAWAYDNTPVEFSIRTRSHAEVLKSGGGSEASEAAVKAGLRWLARHQEEDGSWSRTAFSTRCVDRTCKSEEIADHDVAMTGLALLAFAGSGWTHLWKDTWKDEISGRTMVAGEVVKKALVWLFSRQDASGFLRSGNGAKPMYGHAIATLAIVEIYALTGSDLFKEHAQKALDALAAAQNPYRGWRYASQPNENDSSVTAWCAMALSVGRIAKLQVSRTSLEGAKLWFDEVTDSKTHRVGYDSKNSSKNFVKGKNDDWDDHPGMTAAAMTARIFMGAEQFEPVITDGAKFVVADLPSASKNAADACYWYWGSMALWQCDGPLSDDWKSWNEALLKAVLPSQCKDEKSCACGSWDPAIDRWGFAGGRIYVTAMNVLTLETYYRFPRKYDKR